MLSWSVEQFGKVIILFVITCPTFFLTGCEHKRTMVVKNFTPASNFHVNFQNFGVSSKHVSEVNVFFSDSNAVLSCEPIHGFSQDPNWSKKHVAVPATVLYFKRSWTFVKSPSITTRGTNIESTYEIVPGWKIPANPDATRIKVYGGYISNFRPLKRGDSCTLWFDMSGNLVSIDQNLIESSGIISSWQ